MRIESKPNLLIAGVPKAGTSSMFEYLAQHPDICPASKKEPGYFSTLIRDGGQLAPIETYQRHFDHCGNQAYVMEATPSYCYGGKPVIEAIKTILDNPRILLILRDPVDRLWSAYTFQRSLGNLPGIKTFEDYIARCEKQRAEGNNFIVRGHLNGLSIGFYGDYLPGWFEEFPNNVKLLFFEELSHSPSAAVGAVCHWLSIDSAVSASFDYSPQNVTAHPRSTALSHAIFGVKRRTDGLLRRLPRAREKLRSGYLRINAGRLQESMSLETKRRLEEIYGQSNSEVAAMLRNAGYRRLPQWLQVGEAHQTSSHP